MANLLRPVCAQDAGAIASIYAVYVKNTTISFEYDPPGEAEILRRIEERQGLFPWLVCEADGRVVGYAYAGRLGARQGYDWACEVSVYIEEGSRQKGVGGQLYTALCKLLTLQGYRTAMALIACPNPQSETFHQRMGFEKQGVLENVGYKFGKPISVAYYGKALLPVVQNPPRPVPFSALSSDDIVFSLQID